MDKSVPRRRRLVFFPMLTRRFRTGLPSIAASAAAHVDEVLDQQRSSAPSCASGSRFVWRPGRIIGDRIELVVAEIEPLHFFQVERTRAASAENRELIAALIDGAVAVDSA